MLQLVFPHLPRALIEQMPQYLERSGFRLDTEHGAREYPAGQIVDYEINRASGDLYKLTCLSPKDAPPFEPYRVSFARDSHGFRNAEPWRPLVDLAIIGDSFVAAEAISDPFWRGIAEASLVLGLPGSGTIEQRRIFEAFAAPREPKTAVLAYFAGNDLKDSALFADMLAKGETYRDRAHQGKQPLEYSVLFNLMLQLRQAFAASSTPCHYPQAAQTSPPQPVAFYDEFLAVFRLDAERMRDSESFRQTSASIADMAAVQKERGHRFVLMYIPQKAELYWRLLSEESKAAIVARLNQQFEIPGGVIDANLAVQRDLVAKLADELSIEFLDLSQPLAEAIADGLQPYFFADTHWNQIGHDIARIALLELLNQTNLDG